MPIEVNRGKQACRSPQPMRSFVLFGALLLIAIGCGSQQGGGLWNLKVGGDAKLISADGSDITLLAFSAAGPKQAGRRQTKASKVEQAKFPAGTPVLVLAIDGDDARIQIKDGPAPGRSTGSNARSSRRSRNSRPTVSRHRWLATVRCFSVCTCAIDSRLHGLQLPPLHLGHVISS